VDMLLGEGQDGLEVFEQLRRGAPQLQGILVSGHAPTERVQLAVESGLSFLQKPYTVSELGKVVQSLLSTR
jgi:DNA-binding NtrC family response regulator